VLAALFVAALWLTTLTHPSEAATRGLALEIKASEAPNAPTVATVNLYTNSYALVIGINDYGRGWQRLSKAVSDARRVAKALEKHGFDVTLQTDLKSDDLAATLKNFFIDRGRDPDARLFVWFAGHGATVDGEGYLVPADGAAPTDETGFLHKALSLRDFGKFARYAKSKHVFSVFDACFAGTIFNVARSRTPPAITRVTTEPVRQFLSSGDAGQEVSDNGEFASMFIEALEGRSRADANADGYLTGTEIGENLTYRMANVTNNRQTPRSGKLRSAKFDRGDFVFRLGGAVSTPSVSSVDRDALFWSSIKESTDAADYQAYLDQYPDGGFAALARIRLKRSSAKVATLATAPEVEIPSPAKPVVGVYPDVPKPGTVFRDCINCPEMVVIPPGDFMMGGTPAEHEWYTGKMSGKQEYMDTEKPRHKVTIKKQFAVGKFEVTRGQYSKFVTETNRGDGDGCHIYDGGWTKDASKSWRSPGYQQTDDHPVTCVSRIDAKEYVKWLTVQSGVQYRLLSEAEFEYVARANTTTMRFWGDDWDNQESCNYSNVADKSSNSPDAFDCNDGMKFTAPVGNYQPNAFGVYDIIGNLREWTEDCWNKTYTGAPGDASVWTTGVCVVGVPRGESWHDGPSDVRLASRRLTMRSARNYYNGFRVARTFSK
jgi:formylglycine-generating enzyme required for sulfatase activity